MDPNLSHTSSLQLARQRQQYRDQLSESVNEDDPLAAYNQFVQWTLQNYAETDPDSGLRELLAEVTGKFKNDPSYKSDLRYLKLWSLYARKVDSPATIYAFLLANDIGTNYSLLYEEYANVLERAGFYSEAENIYRVGITRNPRALSRLKSRFQDFQSRIPSSSRGSSLPSKPLSTVYNPVSQVTVHENPNSNHSPSSRYAVMLAPPAPGKRHEKLRFDLSLLFTEDGKEYSAQEARARSMGLLGKKWGPPPVSESTQRATFKDDLRKQDPSKTTRTLPMGEPTVTINTKQALADVFGMYNSPEKTVRSAQFPGSKHAPLKRVEPVAPIVRPPKVPAASENIVPGVPAFRPYVDDNGDRKENATPAPKFRPFVDPAPPNKVPTITLDNRRALSVKAPGSVSESTAKPKPADPEESDMDSVFSRVFTPASAKPLREVRKDDRKQSHSQLHDILPPTPEPPSDAPSTSNATFTPFVDAVFTRPPSQNETTSAKSAAFKPVSSSKRPTPFVPLPKSRAGPLLSSSNVIKIDDKGTDDDQIPLYDAENTQQSTKDGESYNDGESYQAVPLRGRFGSFDIMTPITERTFEFTMNSRISASGTPSENSFRLDGGKVFGQQAERDALKAAEQLAAELRGEEGQEGYSLSQDSFEESDTSFEPGGENSQLFRFPNDGAPTEAELEYIEEKTGTLSLLDALTVSSKFKPPNPCNPFDPPILLTLLSLLPSDEDYHFLKDRDANMLDGLRKFAKRARKLSGDTATGVFNLSSSFPISLGDRRFNVMGKLGEGGFGTVFQAKESNSKGDGEEEDDDDDDDSSMVALKVVKPRNIWEYHVLRRLHCALPNHLRRSVVLPHALYAFRDESFLILDLCPQGTLLDIVNNAGPAGISQQGACLDELLVMFFSVELLRLVGGMHSVGFIHGDLKIDNCLLRLEDVPGGASAWSSLYQPSGKGGWDHKGIKVIDFGRTIDTRLFPAGQKFIAEWAIDDRDCLEVRENRPWTFQTDYFGLAGIIYCMLFGKYIQGSSVTSSPGGPYKIATPFKRYWQNGLWNRLFHVLLNPCLVRPDGHLPLDEELGTLRQEMETWLENNCNRSSNTLKGLLKKVEVAAWRGST